MFAARSRAFGVPLGSTLAVSATALTALAAGQQGAAVEILAPATESTEAGPDLVVRLGVRGVTLGESRREGAYVLLQLDRMPPVKCYAERFTFRGVADGRHRLEAELRRADGSSFEPPARAEVQFTVGASDVLARDDHGT